MVHFTNKQNKNVFLIYAGQTFKKNFHTSKSFSFNINAEKLLSENTLNEIVGKDIV